MTIYVSLKNSSLVTEGRTHSGVQVILNRKKAFDCAVSRLIDVILQKHVTAAPVFCDLVKECRVHIDILIGFTRLHGGRRSLSVNYKSVTDHTAYVTWCIWKNRPFK